MRTRFLPSLAAAFLLAPWAIAQPVSEPTIDPSVTPAQTLDSAWVSALKWRSIGPANMGGRITAVAVVESDPTTYYIATASGGLLKTVNNGTTFSFLFDKESTVSIGDIAVAPSDPKVVWVGTGENNPRNSVSYGDGVYKSTDGGQKWTNMGLKQSFQIGTETPRCRLVLGTDDGGAGVGQGQGGLILFAAAATGERDQETRLPKIGKFGDGPRAGSTEHECRGAVDVGRDPAHPECYPGATAPRRDIP